MHATLITNYALVLGKSRQSFLFKETVSAGIRNLKARPHALNSVLLSKGQLRQRDKTQPEINQSCSEHSYTVIVL